MTHELTDAECDAIEKTTTKQMVERRGYHEPISKPLYRAYIRAAFAAGAASVTVPREPTQDAIQRLLRTEIAELVNWMRDKQTPPTGYICGDALARMGNRVRERLHAMYDAAPARQDQGAEVAQHIHTWKEQWQQSLAHGQIMWLECWCGAKQFSNAIQRAEVASATREDAGNAAVKDAGHDASTSSHPTPAPDDLRDALNEAATRLRFNGTVYCNNLADQVEKAAARITADAVLLAEKDKRIAESEAHLEWLSSDQCAKTRIAASVLAAESRLAEADKRIAELERERDDLLNAQKRGWQFVFAEPAIKTFQDMADTAESRLAAATKVIAELALAWDAGTDWSEISTREIAARQAARAFLERK